MPNFTGAQLRGVGTVGLALTAGTAYEFVMVVPDGLSGSGYFTFETVKNNQGNYSGSATNALGVYSNLVNIPSGSLIKDSFKSSIVVHKTSPTAVSYRFTPASNIEFGDTVYRSTGNIGLQLNAV